LGRTGRRREGRLVELILGMPRRGRSRRRLPGTGSSGAPTSGRMQNTVSVGN
jgi:hypothetical protein